MKYLSLIAGGSIGTLLRFLTSSWVLEAYPASRFPWGTFIINLSGSFVIGTLAGLFQIVDVSPNVKLFLFAGLLGGFTTYSGYALETFQLIKTDQFLTALIYIVSTTLLGIILAALGYWLTNFLISGR